MRAAFGCNSCKEWHDGGRRKEQLLHMLVSLAVFLLLSIKYRSNTYMSEASSYQGLNRVSTSIGF